MVTKPFNLVTGIEAVKLLPVLLCFAGIIRFAFRKDGSIISRVLYTKFELWAYILFAFVYVASIMRLNEGYSAVGMANEILQVLGLVFFSIAFFNHVFRKSEDYAAAIKEISYLMIAVLASLLLANTLAFVAGVEVPVIGDASESEWEDPAVIAGKLGLNILRDGMLFCTHHNNAAIATGTMVLSIFLFLFINKTSLLNKIFLIGGIGTGMYGLLVFDARGPIGIMLLLMAATPLMVMFRQLKWFKRLVPVMIIFPFIMMTVLGLISQSSVSSSLSRESSAQADVSSGNGRSYIWEHCIAIISRPQPEHIVGYGQMGHMLSGADKKWAWKFPNFVTHSFTFQTFFDQGYLGLGLLFFLFYNAARNSLFLYKQGYKNYLIFAVFPLYYLSTGLFESTFGVYNHIYTSITLIFLLFPIIGKNEWYRMQSEAYIETKAKESSSSTSDKELQMV